MRIEYLEDTSDTIQELFNLMLFATPCRVQQVYLWSKEQGISVRLKGSPIWRKGMLIV